MGKTTRNALSLLTSGILACLSATAGAQTIFTEDFNTISAVPNLTQNVTGLPFAGSLDVTGWTKAGGNAAHIVDLGNGTGNYALQLFGGISGSLAPNVLTQTVGIAANDSGVSYDVSFLASPTVGAGAGAASTAADGLKIEVLRGNDTVLFTYTNEGEHGAWAGAQTMTADSFTYVGDGSGDVRIRLSSVRENQTSFGGTIDDLSVSVAGTPTISITTFTADPETLGDAGDAVTFDWTVTGMPLDSLVITPGDIDVLGDTDGAGIGSYVLATGPDGTTEYTLTATKGGDTVERKVTVTLPAPEITSFTASPSPIASGEDVTLSWQVGLPTTTLTITPGGIDVSGDTAGSIIVNPTESTSYTLTATRGTSTSTANASVIVQTPRDPNALFFDDFNSITGPAVDNTQADTGFHFDGPFTVSGWTATGFNAAHVVDLSHPADTNYAAMIFAGRTGQAPSDANVLTQTIGLAANDSGVSYEVSFLIGPTVGAGAGSATTADDGLVLEVLRGDDSVLATQTSQPGAWGGGPDHPMSLGSFTYVGDGTGDVRIRIRSLLTNVSRHSGAIDDLQISVVGSGPLITSITRVSGETDVWELTLLGAADTGYELRSSTTLDFNPGTLVESLTAGVPAVGTIGGDNDSVVTTDGDGDATVRMMLAGPKNFVRAQIPPPLYEEGFESGNGGFEAIGTPNDWEWGTPDSDNDLGLVLNTGNSTNCWGTKLGTGGIAPFGVITIGADSILRGPDATGTGIDLTGVLGAELRFAAAVDAKAGDTLEVLVKEVGTDNLLVTVPASALTPPATAGWANLGPFDISAAAGKNAYLEFRFQGTDAIYIGLYIDDVVVTDTTP